MILSPSGMLKLQEGDELISIVDSWLYCVNENTHQFVKYPLIASQSTTPLLVTTLDKDICPEDLYTDGHDSVIVYTDRLLRLSDEGAIVGEIDNMLYDPSSTYSHFFVSFNKKIVVLISVQIYGSGIQAQYHSDIQIWDCTSNETQSIGFEKLNIVDIESITPEDDKFIILARAYDIPDTILEIAFYPDSKKMIEIAQIYDNGIYTFYNGIVYGFQQFVPSYQFFKVDENDGSIQMIKNIRPEFLYHQIGALLETSSAYFVTDKIFFDEHHLALIDSEHHVIQLFSVEYIATSNNIKILYPARLNSELDGYPEVGDLHSAFMDFEERERCRVDAKGVSASRFTEYLRLNLLAGDAEFDVIHEDKCDEGDLFYAILRYGLYLPLEEQEGIVKNYENFAGGVKEYMTRDGHLIGIPFRFQTTGFVVTPAYQDSSLPVPDLGWTLEDFWNICEEARPLVNGGTALTEDFYLSWIFEALIQSGMEKGWLEEDAFVSAARKLTEYSACGVIRPFDVNMTYLLENRLHIPAVEREYAMVDVAKALPLPLVDGERFCPLSSFVWAYRDAGNPTLAVRYLEMLSSDDYIYEANDRTLYGSDPDRFFKTTLAMVGQIGMTERIGMEFTERDRLLLSKTSELMSGQKLEILDHKEAEDVIRPILDKMFAGELSAEDAAKEIVKYAERRYFE